MPQSTGTKTLGDVSTWVTEQFGDVASVEIDNVKIARWTNMAMLELAIKNPQIYQGKSTQTATPGQNEYTYPAGVVKVYSVKVADTFLTGIAFEQISMDYANVSGDPQYWTQWANQFQLWPAPSAADTITIYYSAQPPSVTSQADPLPLPDTLFPRICDYVFSKAQELDEDYSGSAASRQIFEDKTKEAFSQPNDMAGSFPVMNDVWYC